VKKEFQTTLPVDRNQGMVVGEPHWYDKSGKMRGKEGTPEGLHEKGDIGLAVRVKVIDLKPNYQIQVDAVVKAHSGGTAPPTDVPLDDQPAWIKPRVERVTLDVHNRLQSCAVLLRAKERI